MTWQQELEAAWDSLGTREPQNFLARVSKIVANPKVPEDVREFNLACAQDSTGHSDLAVSGYRRALELGLSGYERRRATIQLASSMRNLGQSQESVRLLAAERTDVGDGLDDAVVVFRSLALVDTGQERAAVAALIHALADHLPRYTVSAHRYADAIIADRHETPNEKAPNR